MGKSLKSIGLGCAALLALAVVSTRALAREPLECRSPAGALVTSKQLLENEGVCDEFGVFRVFGQRYSTCGPVLEIVGESKLNRIQEGKAQSDGDFCVGYALCKDSTYSKAGDIEESPPSRTLVACRAPAQGKCEDKFTQCANYNQEEFGVISPRVDGDGDGDGDGDHDGDRGKAKPQAPANGAGNVIN